VAKEVKEENLFAGNKRQRGRLGNSKQTSEQIKIEYEFEATIQDQARITRNAELDAIMTTKSSLAVLDQG
jgi:uncharacterized membrane protein